MFFLKFVDIPVTETLSIDQLWFLEYWSCLWMVFSKARLFSPYYAFNSIWNHSGDNFTSHRDMINSTPAYSSWCVSILWIFFFSNPIFQSSGIFSFSRYFSIRTRTFLLSGLGSLLGSLSHCKLCKYTAELGWSWLPLYHGVMILSYIAHFLVSGWIISFWDGNYKRTR